MFGSDLSSIIRKMVGRTLNRYCLTEKLGSLLRSDVRSEKGDTCSRPYVYFLFISFFEYIAAL